MLRLVRAFFAEPHLDDVERARRGGLAQPFTPGDNRVTARERSLHVGEGRESGVVPLVTRLDVASCDQVQDGAVGERRRFGGGVPPFELVPVLELVARV